MRRRDRSAKQPIQQDSGRHASLISSLDGTKALRQRRTPFKGAENFIAFGGCTRGKNVTIVIQNQDSSGGNGPVQAGSYQRISNSWCASRPIVRPWHRCAGAQPPGFVESGEEGAGVSPLASPYFPPRPAGDAAGLFLDLWQAPCGGEIFWGGKGGFFWAHKPHPNLN